MAASKSDPKSNLVTHVFVSSCEPSEGITNPIPTANIQLFVGVSLRSLKLKRSREGFRTARLLRNPESEPQRALRKPNKGNGTVAKILEEEILVRSQAVVARVVAGETLIVPVRAKVADLASIYSLNGTGSLIWKLLGSPRTVAQLATALAQEYEVESGQVGRDVTDFVSEMKAVGLVELSASVAMAGD